MTCIAAITNGTEVWMGADSAGVCGYDITTRKDEKIWAKSGFLFGFTSSFRMGQLLRYQLSLPQPKKGQDNMEYMATDFIEEVRKVLKSGGYTQIDKNVEEGGHFLVGYHGAIYHVEGDFQVGVSADNIDAVGCGRAYALATLYTLQNSHKAYNVKLNLALQTAAHFSAGVQGPFIIKRV